MEFFRRKWKDARAETGLYIAALLFAVLLCAFAHYELSNHLAGWSSSIFKQGGVCLAITLVYLLWPRSLVSISQVLFVVLLAALFIYNTIEQRSQWVLSFLATALLLGLYGLAEAFEIAFTKLQGKELDQFTPARRRLLENIRDNDSVFLDAREWVVISLVIGLTLVSDFERLEFPSVLAIPPGGGLIRVAFSLIFTTVIVVSTVQGPGKDLAWENPTRFLDYCGWLWRPLLFFGTLMKSARVFEPGDRLRRVLSKALPGFKDRPNLQPSEKAFFCAALKRYGYALYKLHDVFTISADGSTTMEQIGLFYVVGGARTQFDRAYEFDEAIIPTSTGEPMEHSIKTYLVPNFGDDIDSKLAGLLEELFQEKSGSAVVPAAETSFGLQDRSHFAVSAGVANKKKAHLLIESPVPLPEGVTDNEHAMAVRFAVKLKIDQNGFRTPQNVGNRADDRFFRSFSFPCGHSRTQIQLDGSSGRLQFAKVEYSVLLHGSPHPIELKRIDRQNPDRKTIVLEASFPLPGVTYQVAWQVWG